MDLYYSVKQNEAKVGTNRNMRRYAQLGVEAPSPIPGTSLFKKKNLFTQSSAKITRFGQKNCQIFSAEAGIFGCVYVIMR